jgi:ferric-dicitrate binding protein FerR (iron transport regulator)
MKLDESMRARLRALAGRERSPALDAPAPARAEQAARGAREVDHRRRDAVMQGLSLACAAALVFAVIAILEGDAPAAPRASVARRDPAVAPPPAPSRAAEATAPGAALAGACAGETNLVFSVGAQRRLDLGARALLVASHGAIVAATQSADCDLRAGLVDGTLAVHARDLQGRALVVLTSRGEVRVKGTVFLVDFYAASGELEVGVEEGHVELVTTQGQSVVLEPGRAAYLGSHLELEPFDEGGRARLRRMLGLGGKRERAAERESHGAREATSEPSVEDL